MSDKIFILATLDGVSSKKDNTLSMRFGTQELTPDQKLAIFEGQNAFGVLVFTPGQETMTDEELKAISEIDMDIYDKPKSINKKIMNTLWVLWSQDKQGYEDFKDYYKAKKEKYLNYLKNQIVQP